MSQEAVQEDQELLAANEELDEEALDNVTGGVGSRPNRPGGLSSPQPDSFGSRPNRPGGLSSPQPDSFGRPQSGDSGSGRSEDVPYGPR